MSYVIFSSFANTASLTQSVPKPSSQFTNPVTSNTPQPTSSIFPKATPAALPYKSSSLKGRASRLSWKITHKNLLKINRGTEAYLLISEHSEHHPSVKQFSTALETPCAAHIKHSLELLTCTSGYLPRKEPKHKTRSTPVVPGILLPCCPTSEANYPFFLLLEALQQYEKIKPNMTWQSPFMSN